MRTFSETLFEQLCSSQGIPCERIPTEAVRTPDFAISLRSIRVICEVKQIDPNLEDLQEIKDVSSSQATGRLVPNRLRAKLKNVSGQLKAASLAGPSARRRNGEPLNRWYPSNPPLEPIARFSDGCFGLR